MMRSSPTFNTHKIVDWTLLEALNFACDEDPARDVFLGAEGLTASELQASVSELMGVLTALPAGRVAIVTDRYPLAMAGTVACSATSRTVGLMSSLLHETLLRLALDEFRPTVVLSDQHIAESGGSTRGLRIPFETAPYVYDSGPAVLDAEPYVAFLTSGSAGRPQIVAHSQRTLLNAYRLVRAVRFELLDPSAVAEALGNTGNDARWYGSAANAGFPMRYVSGLPVASIGGFTQGIQSVFGAEQIYFRPIYDPQRILQVVAETEATTFVCAPSTAQGCLRASRQGAPGLVVIGLGGSTVPEGLHARLEETFQCRCITGYGSTELGGMVATTRFTDEDDARWNTCGRPVPGVEMRASEEGELQVRSPALALGYLGGVGEVARWILATVGTLLATRAQSILALVGLFAFRAGDLVSSLGGGGRSTRSLSKQSSRHMRA